MSPIITEYYYCRLFSVKTPAKELDGFAGIGKKNHLIVAKMKFQKKNVSN